MKRLQLTLIASIFAIIAFAQTDKMIKHYGKAIDVKALKVSEFTINHFTTQSIKKELLILTSLKRLP